MRFQNRGRDALPIKRTHEEGEYELSSGGKSGVPYLHMVSTNLGYHIRFPKGEWIHKVWMEQ